MRLAISLLVVCMSVPSAAESQADPGVDQYIEQAPGAAGQTARPDSSPSTDQGSNAIGGQGGSTAGSDNGDTAGAPATGTPGSSNEPGQGAQNSGDKKTEPGQDDTAGSLGAGPTGTLTQVAEVRPTPVSHGGGRSTGLLVGILGLLTVGALLTGYLVRRRSSYFGLPAQPRHDA